MAIYDLEDVASPNSEKILTGFKIWNQKIPILWSPLAHLFLHLIVRFSWFKLT